MDKWDFKPVEQLREECFINSQIGKQIKGDLGIAKFLEEQEQKMWKMRQESYLASVKLAKELEEETEEELRQIKASEVLAKEIAQKERKVLEDECKQIREDREIAQKLSNSN